MSSIDKKKIILDLARLNPNDILIQVKNGLYLFSSNILSLAFLFILPYVFGNYASKELYGQYNYVLSILGFLAAFTLTGMNEAIIQAIAKGKEGVFVQGTKERVKWSILGSFSLVIIGAYYVIKDSPNLGLALIIAAIIFPFYNGLQTYTAMFTGKCQFNKLSQYRAIGTIIPVVVIATIVYCTNNLIMIITAYLVSTALFNIIFFYLAIKKIENNDMDSNSISFGKHMTFIAVISDISLYVDKIILGHYLDFEAIAVYSFAISMPEQVKSFSHIISTLILPKLSIMEEKQIKKIMRKRFLQLMALCIGMIIVYWYIAPVVFHIFFPNYMDSVYYSKIYMVSFITLPSVLLATTFKAKIKTKELYIFNIVSSISQLVLLFVLVPTMGIMGAILSRVLGRLISLVVMIVLFARCMHD